MKAIFLSILMFSPFIMAGKATLTGTADVSAKNDYVEFILTVRSECYKTSQEAKDANNELVVGIQAILKDFQDKDSEFDRVYTSGGRAGEFSATVYDSEEPRTICLNTFQKTTTITFRTGDVDGFSETFDAIESRVVELKVASGGEEDARDKIDFSTPFADICEKTVKALDGRATAAAVEDARRRFEACRVGAGIICVPRIVSITDHQDSYGGAESYAAPMAKREGSRVVEVSFPDRHITRQVRVEFSFQDESEKVAVRRERKSKVKFTKQGRKFDRNACFHNDEFVK